MHTGMDLPPLSEEEDREAALAHTGPRGIRDPFGLVLLGAAIGIGYAVLDNIILSVLLHSGENVTLVFRAATGVLFQATLGALMAERLIWKYWFGERAGFVACVWLGFTELALARSGCVLRILMDRVLTRWPASPITRSLVTDGWMGWRRGRACLLELVHHLPGQQQKEKGDSEEDRRPLSDAEPEVRDPGLQAEAADHVAESGGRLQPPPDGLCGRVARRQRV